MDNVIEVEIKGKITENDMKNFEDYFNQKKKNNEEINLLMCIDEINYSLDGFIEDLKFDTSHWDEFNKIALLSDKKWIEVGSKIIEYLPKIEVEHFNYNERDKAMAWFK